MATSAWGGRLAAGKTLVRDVGASRFVRSDGRIWCLGDDGGVRDGRGDDQSTHGFLHPGVSHPCDADRAGRDDAVPPSFCPSKPLTAGAVAS